MPTTGIFIALTTSAAAFGLMELILEMLKSTKPAASSTPGWGMIEMCRRSSSS